MDGLTGEKHGINNHPFHGSLSEEPGEVKRQAALVLTSRASSSQVLGIQPQRHPLKSFPVRPGFPVQEEPGRQDHAWGADPALHARVLNKGLLGLRVDHPAKEGRIIFMRGCSWTWDLHGKGVAAMAYRDMLIRLCSRESFRALQTNDPNVMLSYKNLFMARIGESVPPDLRKRFKLVRFSLNPDL